MSALSLLEESEIAPFIEEALGKAHVAHIRAEAALVIAKKAIEDMEAENRSLTADFNRQENDLDLTSERYTMLIQVIELVLCQLVSGHLPERDRVQYAVQAVSAGKPEPLRDLENTPPNHLIREGLEARGRLNTVAATLKEGYNDIEGQVPAQAVADFLKDLSNPNSPERDFRGALKVLLARAFILPTPQKSTHKQASKPRPRKK